MSQAPDYNGRIFRSTANSPNGEVNGDTVFFYFQEGAVVWGVYAGGTIQRGTLIATVDAAGVLDMRYVHASASGELRTGQCRSTPERLPDGRLRLHEAWQWTSGDQSSGRSIVEELTQAEASAFRARGGGKNT